jgi:glycosyltransferase involved in cell wall biosynthesis
MHRVLILSPDFPPRPGGVADHTAFLAAAFAADSQVTVVTSVGAQLREDYEVRPVIRNWQDRREVIAAVEGADPGAMIVWQYVPHMYGRGGVNPAIPDVLRHWKASGRSQALVAHEICMPWSAWPHRFYYALAQRRQWRSLAGSADRIGISTEAWIDRWVERWPWLAPKSTLTPSPSNIPVVACPPGHRAAWREAHGLPESALVLTFFGTLSAAKQFDWVEAAWRRARQAGRPVALVVLGGKPTLSTGPGDDPWFKPMGRVQPEDVSRAFQATDVLLLPFVDGASERRTSFTAGLSHGLAIVATVGESTGRTLRADPSFAATDAKDRDAFVRAAAELVGDPARRIQLGQSARKSYLQNYDWPVVIHRLRESPTPGRA